MTFESMTRQEQEDFMLKVYQFAEDFWFQNFGNKEASEVDKMRYYSNHGQPNTDEKQDAIKKFFEDHGYWRDGRTTLKEREKQLILQKTELARERKRILDSRIENLKDVRKRVDEKIDSLESIPNKVAKEFLFDKEKKNAELQAKLSTILGNAENYIREEVIKMRESLFEDVRNATNKEIDATITYQENLKKEMHLRVEQEVNAVSLEIEADLAILGYKEQDDGYVTKIDETIRDVNRELNALEPIMKDPSDHEIYSQKLETLKEETQSIETPEKGNELDEENGKIPCPFCKELYKEKGGGYNMERHLKKCPQNPINFIDDHYFDDKDTSANNDKKIATSQQLDEALKEELDDLS